MGRPLATRGAHLTVDERAGDRVAHVLLLRHALAELRQACGVYYILALQLGRVAWDRREQVVCRTKLALQKALNASITAFKPIKFLQDFEGEKFILWVCYRKLRVNS